MFWVIEDFKGFSVWFPVYDQHLCFSLFSSFPKGLQAAFGVHWYATMNETVYARAKCFFLVLVLGFFGFRLQLRG